MFIHAKLFLIVSLSYLSSLFIHLSLSLSFTHDTLFLLLPHFCFSSLFFSSLFSRSLLLNSSSSFLICFSRPFFSSHCLFLSFIHARLLLVSYSCFSSLFIYLSLSLSFSPLLLLISASSSPRTYDSLVRISCARLSRVLSGFPIFISRSCLSCTNFHPSLSVSLFLSLTLISASSSS